MAAPDAERPVLPELSFPEDHIRVQMGIQVEPGDGRAVARFTVRPSMWGSDSTRPRLSLFALVVDNLSGHLPTPVVVPTVDLRAQFVSEPPTQGVVEIHGHTLRVGRRTVVSEFEFRDAAGEPFGRAITTMANNPYDGWEPDPDVEPANPIPSFDRLLGVRVVDERRLELDTSPRIANGVVPTPHGGAQMLFCELAAEHLAGHPMAAVDIDTHFLRPGQVGPLLATARHAGSMGDLDAYRVDLTDSGAGGTLVAAVTVMSRPARTD